MLTFVVRLFALLGFLVVAGLVALVVVVADHSPTLPERIVLEIDIDGPLAEASSGGLDAFLRDQATLRDVLDTIERARDDDRVRGMIVRFGADALGFAQAQEIRAAVGRFRGTGRFALAYADAFGDGGAANRTYLLASAFDEIWLQPMGVVSLTGLSAQVPFARAALDEIGVLPQFQQRERFKTFGETFTATEFTPEHREMMVSILNDLVGQMAAAIAESRRMTVAEVRAIIDRAPLLDQEALAARIVDRLGYYDEVAGEARRRSGGAEFVHPLDYLAVAGGPHDEGPTVALIHAVGMITRGDLEEKAIGEPEATARRVVQAFEEATKDPDVIGILFRIDSGGGSVTASESIRRAVEQARKAGKPVVVSMGDTAASGGYWIAMNADRIIAAPTTLTGSIGVVVGKFAARGLSERLGLNWGVVNEGRNAGIWSPLDPFSPSQEQRVTALIDSAYDAFLAKVGEARGLAPEATHAAAQGRVWTGSQALGLGLIDELGDQETALAALRRTANLADDSPVTLSPFPRPKSPIEEAYDLLSGKSELAQSARALGALLSLARPLAGSVRSLLPADAFDATAGGARMRMPSTGLAPVR